MSAVQLAHWRDVCWVKQNRRNAETTLFTPGVTPCTVGFDTKDQQLSVLSARGSARGLWARVYRD